MKNENLNCPNCGHEINVNEIVYEQIQQKLKIEFGEKTILEKKELEKKLRKEIKEETSHEVESYKEQLAHKSAEIKDFNLLKTQIEVLKREKDEQKSRIEFETEQRLTQKLISEREKIKKELDERNALKVYEKEHIIEQLKEKLNDAQRKIEQGSMQLQGEVQEVAIEEYLRANFPFDTVEEIKKGARGADCNFIINTSTKMNIGSIYIESKRTKDFQASWIEKFKTDMREKSATLGIIVTDVMPKGMDRLGQREGVWICSFDEFKSLCFVLRESLVLLSNVEIAQENKGDKMNMLYDYLTGNEFRMQIQAVVEGLTQMNIDLISEKRAIESIWKKREKQIYKAGLNMSDFYSSIKGIAGAVIGEVAILELATPNTEN